jgi:hypothetical protein
MATIKVRHLIKLRGGRDALPRYFWQPSSVLRQAGWAAQRVPDNWRDFTDPVELEGAAIAAAQRLNQALDRARASAPKPARAPSRPLPVLHTVADLIALYSASEGFSRLAPATKRGYRQCLERIELWAGPEPVKAIDFARIEKLKAGMRTTPSFRNHVIVVLRLLLERAVKLGWIARNPAARPELRATEPSGLVWPREAVTAFVDTADRLGRHSIGTAVFLNEWIGQRQGDVLRLPRSIVRTGVLTIRQRKTGAAVTLPIDRVPALQHRLEQEFARHDRAIEPTQLIVDETTGRAYQADRFRHLFAMIRGELAAYQPSFPVDYLLPGRSADDPLAFTVRTTDLQFMHLRHTAVVRLQEANCEDSVIAAVTGHSHRSIGAILQLYGKRTRALARLAFDRRLAAEGNDSSRGNRCEQNGK